jgi:hypothetical protein
VILRRAHELPFDFICMTTRAVAHDSEHPGSTASRLFRESSVPIIALPAGTAARSHENERAFFRASVELPAELEVEGLKRAVPVRIRNVGARGAELETKFEKPLPAKGLRLLFTVPTRSEPLELATTIVAAKSDTSESGDSVQVLHVAFPSIGTRDQDAIVAFLNKLRIFEQQQRTVKAPVSVEVVTGPRACAVFKGQANVVRPDYVWLHMDTFDHIEGDDVSVRLASADGRANLEFDGTVASAKATETGFDVELQIAEASRGHEDPGQKLMAFVRQNFAEEAADTSSNTQAKAQVLIPKVIRTRREAQSGMHAFTGTSVESRLPSRNESTSGEVSIKRRTRDAERHALDSMLRPQSRRGPTPLRSI